MTIRGLVNFILIVAGLVWLEIRYGKRHRE